MHFNKTLIKNTEFKNSQFKWYGIQEGISASFMGDKSKTNPLPKDQFQKHQDKVILYRDYTAIKLEW